MTLYKKCRRYRILTTQQISELFTEPSEANHIISKKSSRSSKSFHEYVAISKFCEPVPIETSRCPNQCSGSKEIVSRDGYLYYKSNNITQKLNSMKIENTKLTSNGVLRPLTPIYTFPIIQYRKNLPPKLLSERKFDDNQRFFLKNGFIHKIDMSKQEKVLTTISNKSNHIKLRELDNVSKIMDEEIKQNICERKLKLNIENIEEIKPNVMNQNIDETEEIFSKQKNSEIKESLSGEKIKEIKPSLTKEKIKENEQSLLEEITEEVGQSFSDEQIEHFLQKKDINTYDNIDSTITITNLDNPENNFKSPEELSYHISNMLAEAFNLPPSVSISAKYDAKVTISSTKRKSDKGGKDTDSLEDWELTPSYFCRVESVCVRDIVFPNVSSVIKSLSHLKKIRESETMKDGSSKPNLLKDSSFRHSSLFSFKTRNSQLNDNVLLESCTNPNIYKPRFISLGLSETEEYERMMTKGENVNFILAIKYTDHLINFTKLICDRKFSGTGLIQHVTEEKCRKIDYHGNYGFVDGIEVSDELALIKNLNVSLFSICNDNEGQRESFQALSHMYNLTCLIKQQSGLPPIDPLKSTNTDVGASSSEHTRSQPFKMHKSVSIESGIGFPGKIVINKRSRSDHDGSIDSVDKVLMIDFAKRITTDESDCTSRSLPDISDKKKS